MNLNQMADVGPDRIDWEQPCATPIALNRSANDSWLQTCVASRSRCVVEQATRFGSRPEPILILGEGGTGRSTIAHWIYSKVAADVTRCTVVSCGSLNSLQGHDSPLELSLTQFLDLGSVDQTTTWVLDNVDEVPWELQANFLRVVDRIQEHASPSLTPSIIAIASSSILDDVQCGAFRQDLYYRLNVLQLDVPPLRERLEDLTPLVERFLSQRVLDGTPCQFTDGAILVLAKHDWPGNLVELGNVVSRVKVLANQPIVDEQQVQLHWRIPDAQTRPVAGLNLEEAETQLILEAVRHCSGNKTAAANELGITPRTLHNKMRKFRQQGLIT